MSFNGEEKEIIPYLQFFLIELSGIESMDSMRYYRSTELFNECNFDSFVVDVCGVTEVRMGKTNRTPSSNISSKSLCYCAI